MPAYYQLKPYVLLRGRDKLPFAIMQTVHWSLTGRCNYRCRHCFMSVPEARYGELSHEAVMNIARQIGECAACPYLHYCGGSCRSLAVEAHGTLLGKDPSACSFFRNGWVQNVAGGEGRASKIDDYWGTAGAVMCGMGVGVALWSPDYKSDPGDKWYE